MGVVVVGGEVSNNKGINLPGVAVSVPALSEKDERDLRWALRHGVDQPAAARPTLQVSYGPDGWQIDVRNDTTQPGWRSLEERLQTAAIIAVLGGWRLSEDREASGQGRFHVTLVGT